MNSKPRLKLFVEGDTEYNYMYKLKYKKNVILSIKVVNMHGGGYKNFLQSIKKESSLGFTAIVIIIDLDKAHTDKKNLDKLIDFCKDKNQRNNIPYILIGNNKDFEFFACCHCPKYKNKDTKQYITKEFHYKSLGDFKADKNVFEFLNKNGRSSDIALKKLKSRPFFNQKCSVKKRGLDITIKLSDFELYESALSYNHSNISDLFDIIT